MNRAIVLLLAASTLGGCATSPFIDLPQPPGVEIPPPPVPMPEEFRPAEGSLWRGDESRRFLAFENRAKRVGDLVTVQIAEQAAAESDATTDVERKSSFDATLNSDIGLQTLVSRPVLGLLSLLGFTDQRNKEPTGELSIAEAATTNKYEGDGSVGREATFTTTVACVVTHVSGSGLLFIEGERHLQINREKQIIRMSGYVRPEDVRIDNTLPSALVANANIEYSGEGVISDTNDVPWLARLLSKALPF